MNWKAIKAGYRATLLLLLPFFFVMVWALLNEKHGLLIALSCGWLIMGNIIFIMAYNKNKANTKNKVEG